MYVPLGNWNLYKNSEHKEIYTLLGILTNIRMVTSGDKFVTCYYKKYKKSVYKTTHCFVWEAFDHGAQWWA